MNHEALSMVKDLRPQLQAVHGLQPAKATVALTSTAVMIAALAWLAAWGVAQGGAGYALVPLAMLAMGPMHHRLIVLHHEAIHGLLYRSTRANDILVYLLAAAVGALPEASKIAHLSHHAYLGEVRDRERPNYDNPPRGMQAFLGWFFAKVSGLEAVGRLLHLLTTMRLGAATGNAPRKTAAAPDQYTTPVSDWIALAAVHGGLLALYALTIGWPFYFVLWAFPLLTISRAIVGVRAFVEHLRDDAVADSGKHRLMTFDSGAVERFVLGPFYFHLHAEHHLFPRIPTWRLPEASPLIRAHPDFPQASRHYSGYLSALRAYLAAG